MDSELHIIKGEPTSGIGRSRSIANNFDGIRPGLRLHVTGVEIDYNGSAAIHDARHYGRAAGVVFESYDDVVLAETEVQGVDGSISKNTAQIEFEAQAQPR